MTDEIGEIRAALPQYDIGSQLGRGEFGVVVSAEHRLLKRRVAIKLLRADRVGDAEMKARFLTEARVLSELRHPHIVSVYDYDEVGDLCFLIMERLDGGTVRDTMQTGGINLPTACAIGMVIASALDEAHRHGVLHRDIKPENLLLSIGGILKVADFGIAKVVDSSVVRTRTSTFLGTPTYMSPEQVVGGRVGPGVDIYATATLMYEMMSGQLPFSDVGGAMAVAHRHSYEDPIPLPDAAPQIPERLVAVVMQGLSRAAADRQPDAETFGVQLAEAARAVLGDGWLGESAVRLTVPGSILDAADNTTIGTRRVSIVAPPARTDGSITATPDASSPDQPGPADVAPTLSLPPPPDREPAPETVSEPDRNSAPDKGVRRQRTTQRLTRRTLPGAYPASESGGGGPPGSVGSGPTGGTRRRRRPLVVASAALLAVAAVVLAVVIRGDHRPGTSGSDKSRALTSSAGQFTSAFSSLRSGIVQVVADSCGGGKAGTGFLVSDKLIVTSRSLLADAVAVSLHRAGGHYHSGTVIGSDAGDDLALIQLSNGMGGVVLPWSQTAARGGDEAAAVSFATTQDPSLHPATIKSVSAVDVELDAALGANSGGAPLITPAGQVVAVASAATANAPASAVTAATAKAQVAAWTANPDRQKPATCSNPSGPAINPIDPSPSEGATTNKAVLATLTSYFTAIDRGDYSTAYRLLSASRRARTSASSFATSHTGSFVHHVVLQSVTRTPNLLWGWLTFTSLQPPAMGPKSGETCSTWSLDYRFVGSLAHGYQIDQDRAHTGPHGYASCF